MKIHGKVVDLNIERFLHFKGLIISVSVLIVSCMEPVKPENEFMFTVVDVGEGLAQIGTIGGHAVVWDIGPAEGYGNFITVYNRLGRPQIENMVISHSHLDHCGGLSLLDSTILWNGEITVSRFEDTTYLRMLAVQWKRRITFTVVKRNDVLQLIPSVQISCLWPPEEIPQTVATDNENPTSLVFLIDYGQTRCIIASDIDSTVQKILAVDEQNLRAQLLVVPHHGSANYSQAFFQRIYPYYSVISCSKNNTYGHPSSNLLSFLLLIGARVYLTSFDGTISFCSNTFYWYN
jgi:competence protein ComEC